MPQPSEPRPGARPRIRKFLRRSEGGSRLGFTLDKAALKETATVVIPGILVILAAFWVASRYIRPAPPDTLVMSTGAAGGAYHVFAQRYRDILARDGVTLELRPSAGSMENLARLKDAANGVDAALIQGGIAAAGDTAGLHSLGSLYYEPLWIFYRGTADLTQLNQLKGRRLGIGAEGSGTRALALQLLAAVGMDKTSPLLEPLAGNAAADALAAGRLDAVFVVGSPDAPVVQRLAKTDGIRLLSLENAEAFGRRFPHLTPLTLPKGVIDLAAPHPRQDVVLLAATANMVVREELHPALAYLLINAAAEVHSASGILQKHREFPSARESEFTLSEQADRYYKSGPPLLRRYLPFWLANLIERMVVLLVPLFAVLVPAFKILPALIEWRVKSRVFRWYGEIRYLEEELAREPVPENVEAVLERLEEIERGVSHTSVPTSYADYAYNLRTHIEVVRNRVRRMAANPVSADDAAAAAGDGDLKPAS